MHVIVNGFLLRIREYDVGMDILPHPVDRSHWHWKNVIVVAITVLIILTDWTCQHQVQRLQRQPDTSSCN